MRSETHNELPSMDGSTTSKQKMIELDNGWNQMNSKVIKNQSEIQPSLTLCHKLYCESETGEKRLMFATDAGNKQKSGSCPTYWCVK